MARGETVLNFDYRSCTHLNKLVGLLSIQPVGCVEGVQGIGLIKLTQQFGEASVDIVLATLGFQALQPDRKGSFTRCCC